MSEEKIVDGLKKITKKVSLTSEEAENIMREIFKYGKNFVMGEYNIIEKDVIFGNNVSVGNFCRIMPGTVIGNNTIINTTSLNNKSD